MNSFVGVALAAGIAIIGPLVLARAKPRALGENSGSIGTSFFFPALGVASLGVAGLCLWAAVSSSALPPLLLVLMFGVLGGLLCNLARPAFVLSWDEIGLHGPNSILLAPKRITIAWDDIARVGRSWTDSIYVEAQDGRRIYWHTGWVAHELPLTVVRTQRPDLSRPG